MNSRITFVIFLFIAPLTMPCTAQTRAKDATSRVQENEAKTIAAYTDSLLMLRKKLDSISVERQLSTTFDSLQSRYARLFVPTVFYRSIPRNRFALNTTKTDNLTEAIDMALLNIYLARPDLIRFTDREMASANSINPSKNTPVKVAAPMLDNAVPLPVEPGVAPVEVVVKKPNFWRFAGDYYLQFLQNYVSENWYKGGESNYSMVASAILQATYNNKQKVKFDNKLELKLGLQTSRADSIHRFKTSEDLIRYTGKLGLQATNKWYYTLQLIAGTQFMRGYKSNDPKVYSAFLAPLTLNLSVGMDYNVLWFNERLKGTLHMAPLAYNLKYVDRIDLAERYGLKPKRHSLHDFGSEFTADLTWQISDMIRWRTRLYGYTTFSRAELEWENTIAFQFNKYISTNFFLYPRFDDSRRRDVKHGYWEFKEFASIGFSYSF